MRRKGMRLMTGLAIAGSMLLTPVSAMAAEQTKSEILADAGVNTILGISTVFIMLIVIALVIYCFKFINVFAGNSAKAPEAPKRAAVAAAPAPAAVGASVGDEELVAAVAAAIAATENIPVDSFRITSITQR